MDFISFHEKGQPKIEGGHVTMGLNSELQDADKGFGLIAKHPGMKRLPIILSEADPEGCAACSSKVNPANNYRNGTLYPAYTIVAYKALIELAQQHGVNLLSMLSWSFEFEDRDYFQGFRSLATNRIDKPVLNLFRMLGLLQGIRVETTSTEQIPLVVLTAGGVRDQPDIDALASVGEHAASVLVWNYHDAAEPAPSTPTRVVFTGLPTNTRRVLLTEFRIDEHHSNAYTAWQAMGSPQQPTPDQVHTLRDHGGLELMGSPTWTEVSQGKLEWITEMPRHGIALLQVTWP